jgi:hypothetical protein
MSDGGNFEGPSGVVRFPYSRTTPASGRQTRYLGVGAMAKILGASEEQTTGHWCSPCQGIWYGYLLEVACPVCGNRHG